MNFKSDSHEKSMLPDPKMGLFIDGMVSDSTAYGLAEIFKVLGDPTRVKIVNALSREELCVYELSSLLDISQSAVSHQLRLLRNLKIVKGRKRGKKVFYSLADDHVTRLFREGLEHVME